MKNVAISIFLIINVIGNIPLYVSILSKFNPKKQRIIIIREFLFALVLLLLFAFCGDNVLNLLGITRPIIGMSGGILLFLISLTMVFPRHDPESIPQHEPIFVPLATPVIAGPGSITAVMVYSQEMQNDLLMAAAIILAWLPSVIIVLFSSSIKYLLGEKGMLAAERFGGMIVSLIGIQMFAQGCVDFIKANF